nr:MAG TPA: hypothetical protein [Caudoviricetes sp.]
MIRINHFFFLFTSVYIIYCLYFIFFIIWRWKTS